MMITTARFPTEAGSKYLQQLCKHFAHKIEVTFDETSGRCTLGETTAEFAADTGGLTVRLTGADAKTLIHARYVVDSHLVNFAFRDGFTGLNWQMAT